MQSAFARALFLSILMAWLSAGGAGAQAFTPPAAPALPAAAVESASRVERIHLPAVESAGVIAKADRRIRIGGVVATPLEASCGAGAAAWPCGRVARTALQQFVRGRAIDCTWPDERAEGAPAQCTVGGRDIGEWLVAQGWAKAEGPRYSQAEKAARTAELGMWSPERPGPSLQTPFIVGTTLTDAPVRVEVSIAAQSMTVVHRGSIVGQWPVSTAREGKETPTGIWTAKWLSRDHRSKLYDNAPMPYSVFYDGDYAIHGTYATGLLGRPASHGCVRLLISNAARLFRLVEEEGLDKTLVIIRQ